MLTLSPTTSVVTTGATRTLDSAKIAGPAHGLVEGGCVRPGKFPGFPKDGFETRPGCIFPPPPPHGGGVSPLYNFQLRNMSDSQLKQEKFMQELSLLVAQFTGDTQGAAEAKAKLGAIKKEELRRGGGLEMAVYKHKLSNMSDAELSAEGRKQQMAYLFAKLTGNEAAASKAQQKLAAVHQEQWTRFDPFPPRPFDLNKLDVAGMTQDQLRDLGQQVLDPDLAAAIARQ
jgi:hypothetical protein